MNAQNVGVGTTTPQSRLHIVAPSGYTFPLLQVEMDGSASPYLIVLPDGKVGVGIANPTEALDVSGNVQFSGALMPAGDAGTAGFVLMSQGTGNPPVWVDTALLKDNWGSQVAVTQSPIVGDGTSANPIGLQVGTNAGDILIWNGTQWVIKSSPFDSVCGTAMANYIQKWTGTELCNSVIYDDGTRVGIGTSGPASSAILDVSSSDKGVLLPRLTLSGYYDTTTTVTKPDTALLVYHKGAPSMPPGYYFWDGEKWRYLYSYNHTQVVFEKILTPCELFNNAWINPSENVVLDPNCKYLEFRGGAPEDAILLRYKLLDAGILPSVNDGAEYTIDIDIGREVLDKGGGVIDGDDIYGLSDSLQGLGFTIPDGNTALFDIMTYVPSNVLTSSLINRLDGFIISGTTTQRKYAKVSFTIDSSGTFGVYHQAHTLNSVAAGYAPILLDPANGLYFEIYTGYPGLTAPDNNEIVRVKYVRIVIKLTKF